MEKDKKLITELTQKSKCVICNRPYPECCLHHVASKGSCTLGDVRENLMPLCQNHHNEVHQKGLTFFSMRYISVHNWLNNNGWEFSEYTGKWLHPNERR